MLEDQLRIQKESFGHDLTTMSSEDRVSYIKEMVLGLVHEAHEALDETSWKQWRGAGPVFQVRFVSELADVQLFLFNLLLASGYPPEVLEDMFVIALETKQRLNVQRQESGY